MNIVRSDPDPVFLEGSATLLKRLADDFLFYDKNWPMFNLVRL